MSRRTRSGWPHAATLDEWILPAGTTELDVDASLGTLVAFVQGATGVIDRFEPLTSTLTHWTAGPAALRLDGCTHDLLLLELGGRSREALECAARRSMSEHDHHHDHDHDHDHHHHGHGPDDPAHPHNAPLTDVQLRVRALESLLTQKGLVDPAALDALVDTYETKVGPRNGAQVVAKAWTDPAFKRRLLEDATEVLAELGFIGRQGEDMVVLENTESVHNMVVCTLCSCYPWPVLGLPHRQERIKSAQRRTSFPCARPAGRPRYVREPLARGPFQRPSRYADVPL